MWEHKDLRQKSDVWKTNKQKTNTKIITHNTNQTKKVSNLPEFHDSQIRHWQLCFANTTMIKLQ